MELPKGISLQMTFKKEKPSHHVRLECTVKLSEEECGNNNNFNATLVELVHIPLPRQFSDTSNTEDEVAEIWVFVYDALAWIRNLTGYTYEIYFAENFGISATERPKESYWVRTARSYIDRAGYTL